MTKAFFNRIGVVAIMMTATTILGFGIHDVYRRVFPKSIWMHDIARQADWNNADRMGYLYFNMACGKDARQIYAVAIFDVDLVSGKMKQVSFIQPSPSFRCPQ